MPSLTDVRFTVLREDIGDGITLAVVMAQVTDPDLADEVAFRDALTGALTLWMQETHNGRAAWEASSQDFNIGDLAAEIEGVMPDTLRLYLEAHSVHSLTVRVIDEGSVCRHWTYDTVLAHDNRIGGPVEIGETAA